MPLVQGRSGKHSAFLLSCSRADTGVPQLWERGNLNKLLTAPESEGVRTQVFLALWQVQQVKIFPECTTVSSKALPLGTFIRHFNLLNFTFGLDTPLAPDTAPEIPKLHFLFPSSCKATLKPQHFPILCLSVTWTLSKNKKRTLSSHFQIQCKLI